MTNHKNRLQIVNWRGYGKDESRVEMAIYGKGDPGDLVDEINTGLPIAGEELSFYVNDNIVIEDGRIWNALDGKYRIRIEKLSGGRSPLSRQSPQVDWSSLSTRQQPDPMLQRVVGCESSGIIQASQKRPSG